MWFKHYEYKKFHDWQSSFIFHDSVFVVDIVVCQTGEAERKIDECGEICLKLTLFTFGKVHQGFTITLFGWRYNIEEATEFELW